MNRSRRKQNDRSQQPGGQPGCQAQNRDANLALPVSPDDQPVGFIHNQFIDLIKNILLTCAAD